MNSQTIKQAFYKSIPVMAGYIALGIGFGILLSSAGYGVLWAAAMSLFIFAGSMQYVGVGLLQGGASVLTTIITTVMVNARHLFYSISMVDKYKDAGKHHWQPARRSASVFHRGNRVFDDRAVCRGFHGAVPDGKGSYSGPHGPAVYVRVPCGFRAGQIPDSGHAADHAGADASAKQRGGQEGMNAAILVAAMSLTTILLRFQCRACADVEAKFTHQHSGRDGTLYGSHADGVRLIRRPERRMR